MHSDRVYSTCGDFLTASFKVGRNVLGAVDSAVNQMTTEIFSIDPPAQKSNSLSDSAKVCEITSNDEIFELPECCIALVCSFQTPKKEDLLKWAKDWQRNGNKVAAQKLMYYVNEWLQERPSVKNPSLDDGKSEDSQFELFSWVVKHIPEHLWKNRTATIRAFYNNHPSKQTEIKKILESHSDPINL